MRNTIQHLEIDDISLALRQFNFTPLAFGYFVCRKSAMEKPSYLSHYRLCVVSEGEFQLGKDKHGVLLHQGDVFIVSPNSMYHASSHTEDSIFFYLDFTLETPEENAKFQSLLHLKEHRYFPSLLSHRQLENLAYLDTAVSKHFAGAHLMVECLLLKILIVMMKFMKESNQTYLLQNHDSAKERLILNCIQYIDHHLSTPFTIKEMADDLNYSENYIYKLFKETFGIPCKTFILDYRLNKALHQLQTTSTHLSDIAESVGFSSIYHFSAAFKKKYGYSPSTLRKD